MGPEVQKVMDRTMLWELYKIALPMALADITSEGFCDEAMILAKRFLARWKAETEATATNFPGGQEPGGED